jgi:predicted alpha/beta-hydrolase family hydrolase
MVNNTTKCWIKPEGESLDILLHGGSGGIEVPFMVKLFDYCVGDGGSVVAFNFPYIERGDGGKASEGLVEELAALDDIVEFTKQFGHKHIRFVGKSLGGLVAAKYIAETLSLVDIPFTHELVILGCIVPYYDISLPKTLKAVTIVQGSADKFGTPLDVEYLLQKIVPKEVVAIQVHEVSNADHSYNTPGTKDGAHVDEALSLF